MPSSLRHFLTFLAPRQQDRTGRRGFTLIETTILISVLLILAGLLAPVVWDSIAEARGIRARNDVTQIAVAVVNFQRDVGWLAPLSAGWTADRSTSSGPVPLLVGPGRAPRIPAVPMTNLLGTAGYNGYRPWVDLAAEAIDDHLRLNARSYPQTALGQGPTWRGPYLASAVESDPWHGRYMVNTWCLTSGAHGEDLTAGCAVFAISAGANGVIETLFDQPTGAAEVRGDDVAARIQ
jgi:type II secretory pathway pseudopilin PulG